MKVLLYGMQSSGASLVTYFLGQIPRSVTVVDLYADKLMPALETVEPVPIVAKAVVTTLYDFQQHADSFRPDRTVLVLRNPIQNYVGLARKPYADVGGPIDEKFERLEQLFQERQRFDVTLLYEDFVQHAERAIRAFQGAGIPVNRDFYNFSRGREEIVEFNCQQSDWCRDHFGQGWQFGNIHGQDIRKSVLYKYVPAEADQHVRRLCPTLCTYFDEYYAANVSQAAYARAVAYDLAVRKPRRILNRVRRYLTGRRI